AGVTAPGYNRIAGASAVGYNDACIKHLRRLERVWVDAPLYFLTTCTHLRKPILTSEPVARILVKEWRDARARHGWVIGRYVGMLDHVHFFCAPEPEAKLLSAFVGSWKEWTSKAMKRSLISLTESVWQEEFFDHILRSGESYAQKWNYVRENLIRAGLVEKADDWPWQGEIDELQL
ncbi:MAG: transposase, partial [Verrucomicrobiota bacterium]|nr:transposase [Verrucomicrobiota bacterium]